MPSSALTGEKRERRRDTNWSGRRVETQAKSPSVPPRLDLPSCYRRSEEQCRRTASGWVGAGAGEARREAVETARGERFDVETAGGRAGSAGV